MKRWIYIYNFFERKCTFKMWYVCSSCNSVKAIPSL